MKLTGSQTIPAARAIVWRGLNNPAALKQCIPGCETIEQLSPTEMQATVVAKVGPVRASFTGAVTLSDIVAPESYRISGQGQGGLAGFASGGAAVRLTELGPNETRMDYDVDAQIGGKMAMLGSRLIDSTARSLAEQFFTKFANLMKAEAEAAARSSSSGAGAVAASKPVRAKPAAKKAVKKTAVSKKAPVKKAAAKKSPAKNKKAAPKKVVAKKSAPKKAAKKKSKR
jgi:carbon monoxide dehydrogenase subunit G